MTRRPTRLVLLAVVLVAAVASACGTTATTEGSTATTAAGAPSTTGATTPTQLFPSDFEGSCQGATVSAATPYDAAATSHKALLFRSYEDGLVEDTTTLPPDWQVTFDPASDAYAAVDIVACAVRTDEVFVQDCTGYESEGVATENVAKLHNATYEVTVRGATTGTPLGSTTLTSAETSCPMFVTFEDGTETIDHFAPPPDAEVVAFLKPFAQP